MKKMFFRIVQIFGALTLCFMMNQAYANDGDPVAMLKSIADQMIAQLQAHEATLKNNRSFVFSLAYRLVVPHADLSEMSMRVLPPKTWQSATANERAQFKKEFTSMLVHTYASALAGYKDETIRFDPIRGGYVGKQTVQVDSTIVRTDGPSVPVSYRVLNKNGQWWLYDMIVDNVSMLESFRSQFADKLAHGNMADLIHELQQHNNR